MKTIEKNNPTINNLTLVQMSKIKGGQKVKSNSDKLKFCSMCGHPYEDPIENTGEQEGEQDFEYTCGNCGSKSRA